MTAPSLWPFGRGERADRRRLDPVFALLAAVPDLMANGLTPVGVAGVCVRREDSPAFNNTVRDVSQTLALYSHEHDLPYEERADDLGFLWWISGRDDPVGFDDAVTGIHLVADTFVERSFTQRLLAATFPMQEDGASDPFVLVYNYRRQKYYPFAPRGRSKERDNAREMRVMGDLPRSLPGEEDVERWYALWDAPLSAPNAKPKDP